MFPETQEVTPLKLSDFDTEHKVLTRGMWCQTDDCEHLSVVIQPLTDEPDTAWVYCPETIKTHERLRLVSHWSIEVKPIHASAMSVEGHETHMFPLNRSLILDNLTKFNPKGRLDRQGYWCRTVAGDMILVEIEPNGKDHCALMLCPDYFGTPREFVLPFKAVAPNWRVVAAWQPDGSPMSAHVTF